MEATDYFYANDLIEIFEQREYTQYGLINPIWFFFLHFYTVLKTKVRAKPSQKNNLAL